jgi:hypothetical protein
MSSIYLQSSGYSDDEEFNYTGRYDFCAKIGLADGPINSFGGGRSRRGSSREILAEELTMLREISARFEDHNREFGLYDEKQDKHAKSYENQLKRFAVAPESEIYMVFHEDCGRLDPPIKLTWDNDPKWAREYHGAWNALSNFSYEFPQLLELWNKLKIPYPEAVARIEKMEPLPLRELKTFSLDPSHMERINELLPQLEDLGNEDEAPYKKVVEQRELRDKLRYYFGVLAADKFRALIGGHKPQHVGLNTEMVRGKQDNFNEQHCLVIQLSQYDNWDRCHDFLKQHCKIEEWTDRKYEKFPTAYWDLTNDPDFAQSKQKVYPIKLSYYDSHAGGW